MGGTDVQSAAPRVGPRAGVRGQPKSPGKAPPGAETSPGRLARASARSAGQRIPTAPPRPAKDSTPAGSRFTASMGGTDVQSAAPVRVGPRAGVRGQPKSPGKAPPGAETSPGRLARASAKLEWKHARPANASPRHRPAPRKIPPLPEVRLLHSFQAPNKESLPHGPERAPRPGSPDQPRWRNVPVA